MKYKAVLFLFIFLFSFSSCYQQFGSVEKFDAEKTKEQVRAVLDQSVAEWNKGNIEAFMESYYENDSLVFIGSKGKTFGWQKTLDNYKKSYPDKESMGLLTFSDIDVMILTEAQVLVSGQWHLKHIQSEAMGRFTLHMVNLSEGWRIVYDHSSG